MMRLGFCSCLLSGFVLTSAEFALAQDVVKGKQLAEKYCAPCHAVGKEGASKLRQAAPFRELARKWPDEDLERAIARSMVMGSHPRTPKSVSEPEGFADIVAYIKSLQNP